MQGRREATADAGGSGDLTTERERASSGSTPCEHAAVRFQVEHRFAAPVPAVAELLVDPGFHRGLRLPDLELLDVVDHRDDGEAALLSLRYAYLGQIDPIASRLLGGRRLAWVQELTVDRVTGDGHLSFAVEGGGDRLHGLARFTLHAEGVETVWALRGEIRVRVPLVGGTAERRILAGFLQRLDLEARHLAERLRADGG